MTGNKTIEAPFIDLKATTIRMGQGGSGVSLLPTIIAFMEETRCALHDQAVHTHPALNTKPNNQGEVDAHSTEVEALKGKLDSISG